MDKLAMARKSRKNRNLGATTATLGHFKIHHTFQIGLLGNVEGQRRRHSEATRNWKAPCAPCAHLPIIPVSQTAPNPTEVIVC